jgi:hypothetical protein
MYTEPNKGTYACVRVISLNLPCFYNSVQGANCTVDYEGQQFIYNPNKLLNSWWIKNCNKFIWIEYIGKGKAIPLQALTGP